MTEATQDDWFNQNPTADELQQMNEAMLEHFANKPIANKKPDDLSGTISDVIDILTHTQLFWGDAKRKDLTTGKKRYLSLYDMVRHAFSNIPATRKKVTMLVAEQEAAIKKAKEAAADFTLDVDASQGSIEQPDLALGRRSSPSKIETSTPAKNAASKQSLTKRQMDLLTEAVMSNLQDIGNEGSRREIKILREKLAAERKLRRKVTGLMRHQVTDLEIAITKLENMDVDSGDAVGTAKTPKNLSLKDFPDAFEK
jgi:hypothetical protein